NAGAVTSQLAGVLDSTTLTGLGMAVGIAYSNLEAVAVHLGSGDDAFRIASTHGGTTLVTGGAGNDAFVVQTISGPTAIDAGAGALSAGFAAGASATDVQAGLQQLLFPGATCGTLGTSRCAQSVFVWALGGEYLIGFQGELGGLAAPAVAGAPLRLDGVNYYDFETLAVTLGSGNDRFNIRGTLPATRIDTGAGDDVVYVSDRADLGSLAGAAAASAGDLAVLNAA